MKSLEKLLIYALKVAMSYIILNILILVALFRKEEEDILNTQISQESTRIVWTLSFTQKSNYFKYNHNF